MTTPAVQSIPHVDEDEAALEGGMAEPAEDIESTAAGLVVANARETLELLVGGLTQHNAVRVLAQISKLATSARQTVAIFDPASGVEYDGLSRSQQKAMLKRARPMRRETTGVEAMKQLVGMLQGHQQAQQAKQLHDVLGAAEKAKAIGNTELAEQLEKRANVMADQLLGSEFVEVKTDAFAEMAIDKLGEVADHAEGFGYGPDPYDGYSEMSPGPSLPIPIGAPLPPPDLELDEAMDQISTYIEEAG